MTEMNSNKKDKSMNLFSEAKKVIAGGVNSPARSFSGVGGEPLFLSLQKVLT